MSSYNDDELEEISATSNDEDDSDDDSTDSEDDSTETEDDVVIPPKKNSLQR